MIIILRLANILVMYFIMLLSLIDIEYLNAS